MMAITCAQELKFQTYVTPLTSRMKFTSCHIHTHTVYYSSVYIVLQCILYIDKKFFKDHLISLKILFINLLKNDVRRIFFFFFCAFLLTVFFNMLFPSSCVTSTPNHFNSTFLITMSFFFLLPLFVVLVCGAYRTLMFQLFIQANVCSLRFDNIFRQFWSDIETLFVRGLSMFPMWNNVLSFFFMANWLYGHDFQLLLTILLFIYWSYDINLAKRLENNWFPIDFQ